MSDDFIKILRDAAENHEWRKCAVTLVKLFDLLDVHSRFILTVEQAMLHLPTFEKYHPDCTDARLLLIQLAQQDFSELKKIRYDPKKHNTPGSYFFLENVLPWLRQMGTSLETDEVMDWSYHVMGYILGDVMTISYWASLYPDDWVAWWKQHDKKAGASLQNPQIQNYERELWLRLADRIEKRFLSKQMSI